MASALNFSYFPTQRDLEGGVVDTLAYREYDVFRNKSNGKLIFFRQTPIERSRFRLWRRIRQNQETMKNDFMTFFTLTFDREHIWRETGSIAVKQFLRWLRKWYKSLDKSHELKYLWKVEWGGHSFIEESGKEATSRMHLHLLTNIPKYLMPAEWFKKGQRSDLINAWGRGILQVKAITAYKSKRKKRVYSPQESVLYYLLKYFQKDPIRQSEDHRELQGITSRRWATSQDYKTITNPEWEFVERKEIQTRQDDIDFKWQVFSINHDVWESVQGVYMDDQLTQFKKSKEMFEDFRMHAEVYLAMKTPDLGEVYGIEEEKYLNEKIMDRKWNKKDREPVQKKLEYSEAAPAAEEKFLTLFKEKE